MAASACGEVLAGDGAAAFAQIELGRKTPRTLLRPVARTRGGAVVLFNGYLAQSSGSKAARDYGEAIELADPEHAHPEADLRLVGDYCALLFREGKPIRLSRSPIRAPPLYYAADRDRIVVSSVPRVLLACGIIPRVDELKLADAAWLHSADESRSYLQNIARVPQGCVVTIAAGTTRTSRFYDMLSLPDVRLRRDEEYVERARELLDEGTAAALRGFSRPAIALSGGLDSPLVALSALRQLPGGEPLRSYTFVPEAGWDGISAPNTIGDERELVERFAAMHPQLLPSFVDNAGASFDHRLRELFHHAGAPVLAMATGAQFHGVWAAAAADRCDVLLTADWGNETISSKGEWAPVEHFLRGRFGAMREALRDPLDPRTFLRRFIARVLVPLLSDQLWRRMMRLRHPGATLRLERVSPLNPDYEKQIGLAKRAAALNFDANRFQPLSRRDAVAKRHLWNDHDAGETYQAFRLLYGMEHRDPTAWRPLVEFCLGLPTDQLTRDGENRRLARRMLRGQMPEAQRTARREGLHGSDWHLKLGERRSELRAELDRLAENPRHAAQLDIARLTRSLDEWPEHTATDVEISDPRRFTLPRALLAARFVDWVEGRNDL